jgi:hypothetical protein
MSKYKKVAKKLSTLLEKKNEAYGNAFQKTTELLKIIYPNGIPATKYKDIHVIVRMLDKINRIAENNDPMGESPYMDLAGYAILALVDQGHK